MKTILIGLLLSSPAFSLDFTDESLAQVRAKYESGKAVLLDTRGPRAWKKGHVKGALYYPIRKLKKHSRESNFPNDLPRDKTIYTHCQAGVGTKAKLAAKLLAEHGYDVRPLKPGYPALIKAGFPKSN